MKENIEQRMMALFGLVAALLILVAAVALNNVREAEVTSDWVNHTHDVILEAEAIQTSLHTAEAALRSYILTGEERDQASYREFFTETLEHLSVAKSLTKDDQRQQQRLGELEALIGKRVEFARKVVAARRQGFEEAKTLVGSDAADQTLREIRKLVERLKTEEADRLQQRDRENFLQAQSTRWTVYVAAILNVAVIGLIFWLIRHDLKARRLVARTLKEANEMLERKVKERTAELAKSNDSLTLENLERKWSQSILERQFRHFEQILHSIGDAIFVISRTGRIIRVNPPATKLSGYSVNDLIGESLSSVIQPDETFSESPFIKALKEGRDILSLPASVKFKNGDSLKVVVRAFPVRDSDKVVGSVVICVPAPMGSRM
jgi:PAS domain S-box-containing protein